MIIEEQRRRLISAVDELCNQIEQPDIPLADYKTLLERLCYISSCAHACLVPGINTDLTKEKTLFCLNQLRNKFVFSFNSSDYCDIIIKKRGEMLEIWCYGDSILMNYPDEGEETFYGFRQFIYSVCRWIGKDISSQENAAIISDIFKSSEQSMN